MKRRDCNFESMSTAELWDLYNELGSKLVARLQAEVTLLQQKLDEIQRVSSFRRHVAGGSANMPPRQNFATRAPRSKHGQVEEYNGSGSRTCLSTAEQWTTCGSRRSLLRKMRKPTCGTSAADALWSAAGSIVLGASYGSRSPRERTG